MTVKKVRVADLEINWDLNPRGSIDVVTRDTYVEHIAEYLENGDDFNEVWGQRVRVTKDLVVVQGCHTVSAMRRVDRDYLLEVEILDVESSNIEETRYYAAQSNRHGQPLRAKQKRKSVRWVLEGTNLRKKDKDPRKKEFLSDRAVAARVGVSTGLVRKVREELMTATGVESKKMEKERLAEEIDALSTTRNIIVNNTVRKVMNDDPSLDLEEDHDESTVQMIKSIANHVTDRMELVIENVRSAVNSVSDPISFLDWLDSQRSEYRRSDYHKYLKSSIWKKQREDALERAEYKCEICDADADEVHHISYDNLGQEKYSDLKALCTSCHKLQHPVEF